MNDQSRESVSSAPLINYDYEFLKGNDAFWQVKGSAFNTVASWNSRRGYGSYGDPTELGRGAMRDFEEREGALPSVVGGVH